MEAPPQIVTQARRLGLDLDLPQQVREVCHATTEVGDEVRPRAPEPLLGRLGRVLAELVVQEIAPPVQCAHAKAHGPCRIMGSPSDPNLRQSLRRA